MKKKHIKMFISVHSVEKKKNHIVIFLVKRLRPCNNMTQFNRMAIRDCCDFQMAEQTLWAFYPSSEFKASAKLLSRYDFTLVRGCKVSKSRFTYPSLVLEWLAEGVKRRKWKQAFLFPVLVEIWADTSITYPCWLD